MALTEEEAECLRAEKATLMEQLHLEKQGRAGEIEKLKDRTRAAFQKVREDCEGQVAALNQEVEEERAEHARQRDEQVHRIQELERRVRETGAVAGAPLAQAREEIARLTGLLQEARQAETEHQQHVDRAQIALEEARAADKERQLAMERGRDDALERVAEMEVRISSGAAAARARELEAQLATLQDAASRMAERLQETGVREREAEAQLAALGGGGGFVLKVILCLVRSIRSACRVLGRCIRCAPRSRSSQRAYEPTGEETAAIVASDDLSLSPSPVPYGAPVRPEV